MMVRKNRSLTPIPQKFMIANTTEDHAVLEDTERKFFFPQSSWKPTKPEPELGTVVEETLREEQARREKEKEEEDSLFPTQRKIDSTTTISSKDTDTCLLFGGTTTEGARRS